MCSVKTSILRNKFWFTQPNGENKCGASNYIGDNLSPRMFKLSNRQRPKRLQLSSSELQSFSSTAYCLQGHKIYRSVFSYVVQLHPQIINEHEKTVCESSTISFYEPSLGQRRTGKLTPQSSVALELLGGYS